MHAILSDHNIEGHFDALITNLKTGPWRKFWEELDIAVESFATLGIPTDTPDAALWQMCQDREIVLFTANRNKDGPDSLEATIRRFNLATSLPVFTLANPDRFANDRAYASDVAERALERLLEIENLRGTGRLFL